MKKLMRRVVSNRHRLYYTRSRGRGNNACQFKALRMKERPILCCSALARPQQDQHMQIQPLAQKGLFARWQHEFDHKQLAVLGDRATALAEDGCATFIIPIMQDLSKQIGFIMPPVV